MADARRYVRAHRPNVLVLDLNMPGDPSLPAIPFILEESPATRVVVLTMQEDPAFAREALQAGASAYVLKEAADEELVQAVRAAATARPISTRRSAPGIAAAPAEPAGPPDDLTEREVEILRLDRPGPHELRDRRAALPQRTHGRVASRAHPAEAPADQPRRARALRARAPARRCLGRPTADRSRWPRAVAPEGGLGRSCRPHRIRCRVRRRRARPARASREPEARGVSGLGIEAPSVVGDRDVDVSIVLRHVDSNRARARVAYCVGQRLLHEPVRRALELGAVALGLVAALERACRCGPRRRCSRAHASARRGSRSPRRLRTRRAQRVAARRSARAGSRSPR